MSEFILIIIGMAIVTYIPRMLPLIYLKEITISSTLEKFLQNMPYAFLGALIFPGILYATPLYWLSLAGGVAALTLALLRLNLSIVVIGAIAVVYLLQVSFL